MRMIITFATIVIIGLSFTVYATPPTACEPWPDCMKEPSEINTIEPLRAWDQIIPDGSQRFTVVLDDYGVRDNETALVWERFPRTEKTDVFNLSVPCYAQSVGGRKGWRFPTTEELTSLLDMTKADPALPDGHPFEGVKTDDSYWSYSAIDQPVRLFLVSFADGSIVQTPNTAGNADLNYLWCVRGHSAR